MERSPRATCRRRKGHAGTGGPGDQAPPIRRGGHARRIAIGRGALAQIVTESADRPTAVICSNDYLAIGAMIEAASLNISVPRELSVTGFDDHDLSTHLPHGVDDSPRARATNGRGNCPLRHPAFSRRGLPHCRPRWKRNLSCVTVRPRHPNVNAEQGAPRLP